MTDYIKHKEYKLPNGRTVTADFDDLGIAKVTIQDMDAIFDILNSSDAVEVVRCKDCKHKPNGYTDDDVLRYPNFPHEENNPCPCQVYEDRWYSWIPNDDFYCSYGERAENERKSS